MLSGFASHEREVIRERSMAGAIRVAESGAWMGGIVPFGYRKVGQKRDARIVISEESIPGLAMSEAEVIREVFRLAAVEKKSCTVIATRLNDLAIPCAYTRDDRLVLRGKRKQRTAGVWTPGRIRGLLTSKTYMGIHEFGKRAVKERGVITRTVSAIVPEETWQKAQTTLRDNFPFCLRGAKTQYLLRGLIKCGSCGLTYIGLAANRSNGRHEFYYRCNGAQTGRLRRHLEGRCPSKAVRGDHLEAQVWSDIETFLRNPAPVLELLQARLQSDADGSEQIRKQIAHARALQEQKAEERSRVVGLYRRGRLTDAELDKQMEEIGQEESALEAQLADLRARIAGADSIADNIRSAETLLEQLRKRLDEPVSWNVKRRLVEVLVGGIRVETVEEHGVKQARTTVTYRFSQPDQPMPLVLPQSYSPVRVVRIPVEPKTIGDHIRKRRLELKLEQKDVARQIGVDKTCMFNWEANTSQPDLRFIPAVIRFLGYDPLPPATTMGERLVRRRTVLGMTQKEAARELRVDPGTLARWERGEREPAGELLVRARRFVGDVSATSIGLRRTG